MHIYNSTVHKYTRKALTFFLRTNIAKLIPTKLFLKIQYWSHFNRNLNTINPTTYSEIIQYLKMHYIDHSMTNLCDKYEVRKYIEKTIGVEYLIPLIAVFDSPDEIEFSKLPDKYILKCTHDSQSIIFCWDKCSFNVSGAVKKLNKKFKNNAYYYSREYCYKDIPKRIICEEIIGDGGKAPNDYKLMCFNGKVHYIIIDYDRFTKHSRDFYDVDWNRIEITTDCPVSPYTHRKPELLHEMIKIGEKLSSNYTHVRVDLYCVNNRIYFGELTFMPWAGLIDFYPDEWNYKFGELLEIEYE